MTTAPIEIKLGDQTLNMSPLSDKDNAEILNWAKNRIIQTASNSFDASMSSETKRMLLDIAMDRATRLSPVSPEFIQQINTVDGWARMIWQGCKKNHPDLKYDDVIVYLCSPDNLEAATRNFSVVNNLDTGESTENNSSTKKKVYKKRQRKKKST